MVALDRIEKMDAETLQLIGVGAPKRESPLVPYSFR